MQEFWVVVATTRATARLSSKGDITAMAMIIMVLSINDSDASIVVVEGVCVRGSARIVLGSVLIRPPILGLAAEAPAPALAAYLPSLQQVFGPEMSSQVRNKLVQLCSIDILTP